MNRKKRRRVILSLRRLPLYFLISAILISFSSCNNEPYFIIDDPYINSEKKSFSSNWFIFKESIRLGSPVKHKTLHNRDEIAFFISEYKTRNFLKPPVISPLIFTEGKELFYQEKINPVVYNFREEKITNNFIGVVESKREKAFFQAGEAAAKILNDGEFLFLFFSVETSQRQKEYESFLEGFYQIKDDDALIEVKITSPLMRRPGDIDNYETLIRGRSIGLYGFFSGSFNIELIDRFINENNKFICEDFKNSLYKKKSYLGSVEDDIPGLIQEGLNIASGKSDKKTIFRPAIYIKTKK